MASTKIQDINRLAQWGELYVPQSNLFTLSEVQRIRRADHQRFIKDRNEIMSIFHQIHASASELDSAKRAVFIPLLLTGAPGWKDALTLLRDEYTLKANASIDLLTKLMHDEPDGKSVFEALKADVMTTHGRISDAVRTALATDDASDLYKLAETDLPDLMTMLSNHMETFRTDHIALDRRFTRAKVYIGLRCNDLEAKGITSLGGMWRTIYQELKSRERLLDESAKAALDWFREQRPFDKIGEQVRRFEHDISAYKQDMKPYYEQFVKSGQKRDKAP